MPTPRRKRTYTYDPVAKDIRTLRYRLGELQEEFAKHFHVTRTTIIKWEQYGPDRKGTPRRIHFDQVLRRLRKKKPKPKKPKPMRKPTGMYALAVKAARRMKRVEVL